MKRPACATSGARAENRADWIKRNAMACPLRTTIVATKEEMVHALTSSMATANDVRAGPPSRGVDSVCGYGPPHHFVPRLDAWVSRFGERGQLLSDDRVDDEEYR